jgi:hypothetical protein
MSGLFLTGLMFYLENGGGMFLSFVDGILDCTEQDPAEASDRRIHGRPNLGSKLENFAQFYANFMEPTKPKRT